MVLLWYKCAENFCHYRCDKQMIFNDVTEQLHVTYIYISNNPVVLYIMDN